MLEYKATSLSAINTNCPFNIAYLTALPPILAMALPVTLFETNDPKPTTGSGRVSIYRNNGSTGTLVWSNPVDYTNGNNNIGQVRKLIFSDNDQFLYAGSGDMYLRKYKVSDGTLVWKAYIGGWPFVNGLAIANGYIVTGTKSKDRTVIRDSDGQVIYLSGAFGYDANVDSTFSGTVVDDSVMDTTIFPLPV